MARSHWALWMLTAIRGVHKDPDPYIQSDAPAAYAHLDLLFQTWNNTLQTTRGNEGGVIRGTHFQAPLFKEKQ